jgi:hypothetical protein
MPEPALQGNAIEDPMPIMYTATWSRVNDVGRPAGYEFAIYPYATFINTPADTFSFKGSIVNELTAGTEGQTAYLLYKLYNQGGNSIEDCFITFWIDPDLGGASDDLVGCDTLDDMFFVYNGDSTDSQYGDYPPAAGFSVLHGPVTPSPGDTAMFALQPRSDYRNLPMYSFHSLFNGLDPDNAAEAYVYMNGLNGKTREPHVYNGDTLRWLYTGDPVTGTGDLDEFPSDRRMIASFGPFDFPAGDSQSVLLRFAAAQGDDHLQSVARLKEILREPFSHPTSVPPGDRPTLPEDYRLYQNYPNPFNPSTTISYSLPRRVEVTLTVYNVLGQRVARLVAEEQPAGVHAAVWDGRSDAGEIVSSGVYFYRLTAGDFVASRKMVLLK